MAEHPQLFFLLTENGVILPRDVGAQYGQELTLIVRPHHLSSPSSIKDSSIVTGQGQMTRFIEQVFVDSVRAQPQENTIGEYNSLRRSGVGLGLGGCPQATAVEGCKIADNQYKRGQRYASEESCGSKMRGENQPTTFKQGQKLHIWPFRVSEHSDL